MIIVKITLEMEISIRFKEGLYLCGNHLDLNESNIPWFCISDPFINVL